MQKYQLTYSLLISLFTFISHSAPAQTPADKLFQVQEIVRKEGELFIAINRFNREENKACLEENSIANIVQFTQDSAFVNYVNHTELFCEVYVMRTHHTYHFSLKDIDPTTLRLVEKKYAVGEAKLKEGKPGWFEVQLFTREKRNLIQKRDIESKQTEQLSTVSLVVQEKEEAKKALALLKSSLSEMPQ